MWGEGVLEANKLKIKANDPTIMPAFDTLITEAEIALTLKAPSVMDKAFIAPSNDKHDYMSMGPYWWPNPDTPDGLPYIRKDGEVNPERNGYDKVSGSIMTDAVRTLTLAYYFTDNNVYALKAAELLRTWFIAPDTKMNPHLNFGQFIPGKSSGRSVGIIESRNFVFLTNYEPLLESSEDWTDIDHTTFVEWMNDFRIWLVISDLGQQEFNRANNHGSWYDYQVLALSQYCGVAEESRVLAGSVHKRRLEHQVDADGKQFEELARTKSFNYSVFNLEALTKIALHASSYGINLYQVDQELQRMTLALDFLLPYAAGSEPWPYPQISNMTHSQEKMIFLLNSAYLQTQKPEYMVAIRQLKSRFPRSRYHLTTGDMSDTSIKLD